MKFLLLVALVLAFQDNKSPFSKDYKGGSSGGKGSAPKKGAASESKNKPANAKQAVKNGLDWLVKNQRKDGSWDTRLGGQTGTTVVTSWCGLALMAAGDAYKEHYARAARYVAKFVLAKSHNPDPKWDQTNWSVSIGGMFLAEYYAETKDAEVREPLERVAAEIGHRMEPSGGYGHCKGVKNALNYLELEVMSNWMMATAGMCRRLNIKVSADMGRAMSFVENCCSPGQGNVGYSPNPGQKGVGCPCRTGGAIFGFALLRSQSHPLYAKMGEYYRKAIDKSNEGHGSLAMGLLESALGARVLGPDVWDLYVSKFFAQIIGQQQGDGSFKHLTGRTMASMGGDGMTGAAYPTGIFTLILQLDLGNLTFCGQRNQ